MTTKGTTAPSTVSVVFNTNKSFLSKAINSTLFGIGLVSTLAFFYAIVEDNVPLTIATKANPLICFQFYLFRRMAPPGTWSSLEKMVMIGLTFSTLGDILLAIPGEMTFLVGLVAFLIGHIFYIRGFQSIGRPTDGLKDFAMTYIPFAIYGLCVVLSAYTFSVNGLGVMTAPVTIYSMVLAGMIGSSFLVLQKRRAETDTRLSGDTMWVWMTFVGAALFVVSDSLICLSMFVSPFRNVVTRFVVMSTYWIAQYLIGFTLLYKPAPDAVAKKHD